MNLKIGTRASKLAVKQAEEVGTLLNSFYPNLIIHIDYITTTGDKLQHANLSLEGGKGLFLKEIEEKLLSNEIDIAVHSLKDVPVTLHEGLEISCFLKRENPYDVLISNKYNNLTELPRGAKIGTSSTRRLVHLKALRPDLKVVPFRGNIITRLQKLDNDEVDACVLAYAGLKRIGLENLIKQVFEIDQMIPAIGQGVICIEHRASNHNIRKLLMPLNHVQTQVCIAAERTFMKDLSGNCTTPMGAYTKIVDKKLNMQAMYFSQEHDKILYANGTYPLVEFEKAGLDCSQQIKNQMKENS